MKLIYNTIKLKISCNKSDFKRLEQCNKESAHIWNLCVSKNNEYYQNNKKLLSIKEIRNIAKQEKTNIICAFNKQTIANKLIEAYKAISKARKAGRIDEKYPYKIKNYYPTEWNYNFLFPDYKNNLILLTTTRYIDEKDKKRNGKQIKLKFKTSIPQNIKTLKLIYENNCYYACISYLVEVEEKQVNTQNMASIDLGEIHSIVSVDNNNNQLIITGRKIRSIKQFRNKKLAELKSKMANCKKGSRQYKKYQKALNYIKNKTKQQIHYYLHKLTRLYTNWAIEKGISVVYIGDVTGIEQNTKENHIGNSNIRQKISQWNYGKIINLLQYKLNLEGIRVKLVNEQYSSQICPNCFNLNKPIKRNYNCNNCNSKFHRDIVGAWNILNFNYDNKLELPNNKIKYLRIS